VRYEIRAVLTMLAAFSLLLSGCKQQSREEAEPAPAATPIATAVPSATAAEPAPPPAETIPPPLQPTLPPPVASTAVKKAAPESIKACCAALHKESSTAADKALYTTAANTCDAIEKLVATGTTKKAAALTTLRAGIKGAKLPPGCE
jgi:type IV secretory pathway VirB10-like protein